MDKKTILLVEDQVITALSESQIISSRGFEVIIAHNGNDAINKVRENKDISLVLMDINLGKEITGTDAAVEILKIREIPVVFLTSHSEKEMVEKVKGITRYGYVLKNSGEFVLMESIYMAYELFEANQKLKKSEQKFRRIFEEGQFGLAISDKNYRFIESNPEFCRMLGYTQEEMKLKTFKDITNKSQTEKDIKELNLMNEGIRKAYKTEKQYLKKNGELLWGSLVTTAMRNEKNDIEYYIAIILDITERKKNEEYLEILKRSVDMSLDCSFWMNNAGKIIYINDAASKSLGFRKDELLSMSFEDFIADDRMSDWNKLWEMLKEKKTVNNESSFKRKDGTFFPVEISLIHVKINEVEYCVGFAGDITSRIQIYEALKESEERYKLITEMTTDYFVKLRINENNEITIDYVSENFYQITGRAIEQIKYFSEWDEIFHPDDLPEFKNFVVQLIKTGKNHTIECRTNVRGKSRWISITGNPQKDPASGKIVSILGAVKDISERKKIEESQKYSEEKYRTLIEKLNSGIFMTTMNGKFLHLNSSLTEMAGYKDNEELMKIPSTALYLNISDRDNMLLELEKNGNIKNMEVQALKKDGTVYWVSLSAVLMYDDERKPYALLGSAYDITARKNIEKTLQYNQVLLNETQHLAKIGSWIWDIESKKLSWSDEVFYIFGVKPGDFVPSVEAFEAMIHPDDRDSFLKQRSEMLNQKQSACIDHRILLQGGKIRIVQERAKLIVDNSGKVLRVIGTVQDITDIKQTEMMIKQNEDKFRILVENLNDVIFTINPDGIITYVSPRSKAVTGFDPDELTGRIFQDIIYTDDIEALGMSFEKVLTGKLRSSEFRYISKDGKIHWARTSSRPIMENDRITGVYGIFSDITEKKLSEQALLKSEMQLSNALLMARLAPWEYDVKKDEFTFNDAFYAIFKTTAKEVGGYVMKSRDYAERFLHADDMNLVALETRKAIDTDDPHFTSQLSHRIIFADGEIGYINVRIFIIKDKHGKTVKTFGVNQDITDQKKTENEIKKLLDERELLLTEVHHRIKNDMNIICSMLMIQIDSCDNPVIREVLMETEVRINVMFNIYNELYMGKEFNYISLKTYITNLISNIKYIYSDQCYTVMDIEIDDIPINRKISFPVGMIINELITNSYKYAFSDRKSYNNIIKIIIHKQENGDITIVAGDNGRGFPENVLNNEYSGFGLKLINMLSKQINGKTKLYNDMGAVFEMHIKAEFT